MGDQSKYVLCLIISCAFCFVFGFGLGSVSGKAYDPSDKEIIKLNIELTKLNIKKLKGECNESN